MKNLWLVQALLCILLTPLCLAGCAPKFGEVDLTDLPVAVSQPSAQEVDVDVVIENARQKVQEFLPGAYLSFFSFTGKCQNLPELRGQINMNFIQVQPAFPKQRVLMASASVDTAQQTMELRVKDYSTYYWSTEPLILEGLKVKEIANLLHEYISASSLSDCTVVLARGNTNGPWTVRCGPPDQVFLECLEIDPTTGEITMW